jgi:hypothetical protein
MTAAQDNSKLDSAGCFTQPTETKPRVCTFGSSASATTVVLMGDSHAEHWFPALEKLANSKGWRVVTLLKSSCPWPAVTPYNFLIQRVEPECGVWREQALAKIVELHPSMVVLGSFSPYVKDVVTDEHISAEEWRQGASKTLAKLAIAAPRVAVLLDTPQAELEVPTCLGRAALHEWYSTAIAGCKPQLYQSTREAERSAASAFPNVRVVDLSDQFCSQGCPPIRNGLIAYRDQHHMTATFSASLAGVLGERLGL